MRHDAVRLALAAGLVVLLAACAGGGGSRVTDAPPEMSGKGLANLQLAQNYLRAGKLDIAIDRANRALRSDPGSADVHVVLGMIRQTLNDTARAGEHYKRAAELGPNTGHVLNAYGAWLCERQQYDQAETMFSRAVLDPFYEAKAQAYYNAGRCSILAGRLDRAEAPLRKGLEIDPDEPLLLEQMARLQFRQGKYLSARAFLQRREALGEVGADMLELAIAIEEGAGDRDAANRYRARLRQDFPDHTPGNTEGSPQS